MSRREQKRIASQLGHTADDSVELMLTQQLFAVAQQRARVNGLVLTEAEGAGHFRLERFVADRLVWSVDLWPTIAEWSRVAWRDGFKGPVLELPRPWTVLDAVDAMIAAVAQENAGGRKRPKPTLRRRR